MSSTRTRIAASIAAAAGIAALAAAPASAATPDVSCQKAGIKTLQGAGLLSSVAKNGVTVRPGKEDIAATLPAVLPFQVVLADHRAGSDSIFVYPWCS